MGIRAASLIAVLSVASSTVVAAQSAPIDRHGTPAVACAPDGGFVVVWESRGQDGDGYGIFGQLFDSAGTPRGGEFLVNNYTTDNQRAPAVCTDGAGNFVIAWESYDQDGDGYGIFAQRFNPGGGLSGITFQVANTSAYSQEDPAVGCSNTGDFIVAWSSGNSDDSEYDIVARRFSSAGVSPSEFHVNTYTPTSQVAPAVAADAAGNFVVVWTSYENQDSDGYGVFGQRFAGTGSAIGTEFQINTYATNNQLAPAVAADANGKFVAAWSSAQDGDSGYGVFGQGFAASGARDGSEFHVNTYTTGDQGISLGGGRVLDVAAGAPQSFVIVWQSASLSAPAQDGDGIGVFGQRFAGAPPVPVGSEFRVNSATAGDQAYPSVCATMSGEFVVVWESRGSAVDAILAQRYDDTGTPVGTEINVNSDTAFPYSTCPGDCNGTNSVSVAELVTGVNILLGQRAVRDCPLFDRNNSTTVTVDEVVAAVRAALEGCEVFRSPTPVPTPTPPGDERTRMPRARGR